MEETDNVGRKKPQPTHTYKPYNGEDKVHPWNKISILRERMIREQWKMILGKSTFHITKTNNMSIGEEWETVNKILPDH